MNLSTLIVQQNNTYYERLEPYDIETIYWAYKDSDLDHQSTFRGAISSNFAYRSHVNELKEKYRSLKIQVSEFYCEWNDPEFQKLISILHGDGTGVINSDLIKSINLNSTAVNGTNPKPFFGNKDVKSIDMRPFTNFAYNYSTQNTDSNLCVVRATDNLSDYSLKEIYLTSTRATGFNVNCFIQDGDGTYMLDKVWYEGPNAETEAEKIYGWSGNYSRVGINHFYWLNHSHGIGYNNRKQITMPNGDLVNYIEAGSWSWNSRGSFMYNIILDSPVPIYIGAHTWGNGKWGQTKLWVPDDQLDYYNYIYATNSPGEMPASISSMSNYNTVYRDLANWWIYPGRISYQFTY